MISLKKGLAAFLSFAMIAAVAVSSPVLSKADTVDQKDIGVTYQVQGQTYGWQKPVSNGELAGTVGKAKRLEAIKINLTGADVPEGAKIIYKTQVQTYGWQKPVSNGELAGTVGQAKRLEAIKITIDGLPGYDVQYRAQVQTYGWQDWVTTPNGTDIDDAALCGTVGKAKRLEAIQIRIVKHIDTLSDGIYQVGKDIPAGKYILYPSGDIIGYFEIDRDLSGSDESIISNDLFSGREIIEVYDGQYLVLDSAILYSESDAPAIGNNGVYSSGMYEVGKDIPAGTYKITAIDSFGYYEIAADCSHDYTSIITNDFISDTVTVELKSGQYIRIEGCDMTKK